MGWAIKYSNVHELALRLIQAKGRYHTQKAFEELRDFISSENDQVLCLPELPTNAEMNGIQKIAAERTRQIEDEKWTPEHDATEHASDNALLMAANSYLAHAIGRAWVYDSGDVENYQQQKEPFCWPDGWKWKPKSPEKDLIRAGALIAAHLDLRNGLDSQNVDVDASADKKTPTKAQDV